MKLFGRRKATALEMLREAAWTCASCDTEHRGMFDLGAYAPDHWGKAEAREPNGALRLDGDFLSEDFCVIRGEHFFIRCVLEIPVHGLAEKFGYGCWSTLSRQNFEYYVDRFDTGDYAGAGPWFGWFSNSLRGFEETLNRPCLVYPQLGRQRPTILLDDPDHDLAKAEEQGISPERLLELYARYGHGPAGEITGRP